MKGFKDPKGKFRPTGKKYYSSPSKNRKKRFENSKIQSLRFPKNKFSMSESKEWATDHGYTAVKIEPSPNYWRIRQFSPNKIKRGGECRTIQFGGSGVQGILCETPDRFKKEKGKESGLRLGLKFPERKEVDFEKAQKEIQANIEFRDKLLDKNDQLVEKIESTPTSTFTESRKQQLNTNARAIKEVENDIKKTINQLSNEQKENLPTEVKNLRRVI